MTAARALAGRPPYRVPTMAEVAAVPASGRSVVSLFSGGGGSSLGYRMAGFRVLCASEFVEAARETYRANFQGTPILEGDVRELSAEQLLAAAGLRVGELDVLDGSPPCASFSMAGKREKHWGKAKSYSDTTQRSDDLFFEYARLLDGVRPRAFVAENVSGLVRGAAKGYFKEILARLQACGYRVRARVLDAQWLGVPQQRQRVIFVGVREDLRDARGRPIEPAHPEPLPYRYAISDALPELLDARLTFSSGFRADEPTTLDEPSPTVMAHGVGGSHQRQHRVQVRAGRGRVVDSTSPCPTVQTHGRAATRSELSIERFAIGREYDRVREGGKSDRYLSLTRPDRARPCPTVTAIGGGLGTAGVVHPTEKRKFTMDELRAICAFPPDFVLTGTYAQQWERLGRAVPPLMMRAIAETVRDEILARASAGRRRR